MKAFWADNGKTVGKTLLNQFGSAFLGIMLFMASTALSKVVWLPFIASVIATGFYVYLIYNVMWDKGGQDRIKVDGGRAEKNILKGLWISLVANIPNIILAIVITVTNFSARTNTVSGTIYTIAKAIAIVWEGMYTGAVMVYSPNNPIIFSLMIIPALMASTFGYYMGYNNKRIFGKLFVKKEKKS